AIFEPTDPDFDPSKFFSGGGGGFAGNAWWKPLDLLKIMIGSNGGDGFYGKEGVTGWGFYQTASDTGVVRAGNAWGGGYGPVVFRSAFFGGVGYNALHLTISPVEMVDINIAVPFWMENAVPNQDNLPEGRAAYIFQRTVFQADLKLDFGNIALTYVGDGNKYTYGGAANPGTIFAYFGLTSIENLGIDVGIGFPLPLTDKDSIKDHVATKVTPISAGLGAKFTTGDFGIKARVVASFAGSTKVDFDGDAGDPDPDPFKLTADILPFYSLSDNLRIYFSAGLGITDVDKNAKGDIVPPKDAWGDDTKAVVAWHINPYVEKGQEWGPKFLAGLKLSSNGKDSANLKDPSEKEQIVKWAIPLALSVGF
ncbi:MAG: hypothetical protein LBQ94_13170, partial [Treponema sp.]|nr:hypothetical protein [Treponema sp.]